MSAGNDVAPPGGESEIDSGHTPAKAPGRQVHVPRYVPVRPGRVGAFLARLLMSPPQRILALFRLLWPIPRLFGWALVLRYDDVAEVLRRYDVFRVPFGSEIARLNDGEEPGTPFLLGMDDSEAHARQANLIMQTFTLDDIETVVNVSCASARHRLKAAARGPFDAIPNLITAVPIDVCREYFGVRISNEEQQDFAYATIELSGHLFGPPPIEPTAAGTEDDAGAYVRAIVDRSIEEAIANPDKNDTVLARLVGRSGATPDARAKREIRAVLIGMIVGFVPTNTLAGGHILEMLLRKPEMMKRAQQAAESGDDDRLMRCLFETLRFIPINLGPWRICARDYCVAADTEGAATIRQGTKVLAMTSSAMFDSRQVMQPFRYDPGRPASNYMHFGFGMHWCIGVMIARTQITQTFKALLARSSVVRAPDRRGKLALWGLFPDHLYVEYEG